MKQASVEIERNKQKYEYTQIHIIQLDSPEKYDEEGLQPMAAHNSFLRPKLLPLFLLKVLMPHWPLVAQPSQSLQALPSKSYAQMVNQ